MENVKDSEELLSSKELCSRAVALAKREEFGNAYRALDKVKLDSANASVVRHARADVCFGHALFLGGIGRFRDALLRVREARHLEPENREVIQLVDDLMRLVGEEENYAALRRALIAMEQGDHESAIRIVVGFPADSSYVSKARRIRSAAYLRYGQELALRGALAQSCDALRSALKYADNAGDRASIAKTLDRIEAGLVHNGANGSR